MLHTTAWNWRHANNANIASTHTLLTYITYMACIRTQSPLISSSYKGRAGQSPRSFFRIWTVHWNVIFVVRLFLVHSRSLSSCDACSGDGTSGCCYWLSCNIWESRLSSVSSTSKLGPLTFAISRMTFTPSSASSIAATAVPGRWCSPSSSPQGLGAGVLNIAWCAATSPWLLLVLFLSQQDSLSFKTNTMISPAIMSEKTYQATMNDIYLIIKPSTLYHDRVFS